MSADGKPTPADWSAIQALVDEDCAMSIVANLAHNECTWEEATDRICAYAEAAWAIALSYHPAAPADAELDVIGIFQSQWNEGLEAAAAIVDQLNREGAYNAIGAASKIRELKNHAPHGATRLSRQPSGARVSEERAMEIAVAYFPHADWEYSADEARIKLAAALREVGHGSGEGK